MAQSEIVIIEGKNIILNLKGLDKEAKGIIGRIVDPPLKKFMRSYTQQNFKPYPPKPPASTYVRTKELYRSWDTESDKRAATVETVNTKDYSQYVVGDDQQWYHDATGWIFLSEEKQELQKAAMPVVERAAKSEIERELFKKGRT